MKYLAALTACAVASASLNAAEVNTQDMIVIPAGAFTMGSDDGPTDEKPRTRSMSLHLQSIACP